MEICSAAQLFWKTGGLLEIGRVLESFVGFEGFWEFGEFGVKGGGEDFGQMWVV